MRVEDDVVKGLDTINFLELILDKELNMTKFLAIKARTSHFNIEKSKGLENAQQKMRPNCLCAHWYCHTWIMVIQHW